MCDCQSSACETCPPRGFICVPKGDDCVVVMTVKENDCDGEYFDISGASEIVFVVADELGGTVRITKKMSLAEVSISTNLYQFYFTVTASNTAALVRQSNYFECQVTSAAGLKKTVLTGIFKATDTMIKDLP